MTSPPPTPKRKRSILPPSLSDALLHPGWSKRAKSCSQPGSSIDSRAPTPDPDSPQNASQSSARPHSTSPQPSAPPQPTSGSSTQANQTIISQIAILNQSAVVVDSNSTPQTHKSSWTGLEKALHALQISTKGCPPLHSAVDGLISCLHVFREAAKFRKDYDELADGLAAMVQLLANYSLVGASREITDKINGISEKIKDELESIDKRQSRGATLRILGPSSDDDDLVRRYRKIEQLFRQLQAEASMSTWNDTKKHLVNTQLESLGPVKLATYNSTISMDIGRRSCTENTRTQILGDLMDWANDPHKAKIYWMNGMAGTGKTTIACSLCERLDAAGQLAASFFCTRTSRECSEAKRIVPTLAYQIARRSAPFRDALCGVLDRDPDIGTLNTNSQFSSLITKPLVDSRDLIGRNLVVVIDALDECSDPHIVKVVLDILFRHAADLPVKFFVTSRPEPTIRNSMMLGIAENERPHSILYLHEIEKSLVQADIELYLKDELKHMLSSDDEAIKELSEQAGNLFIYAATAVRYIQPNGKVVNSRQRLKTILEVDKRSKKTMSDIDILYSTILNAAICDPTLEVYEQESIQNVLWTSICVYEPVLISTLAMLSGLDETDLATSALEPLRSVLHVSEHNNYVTTLHASFPDFMFSQERSQKYFCNRSSHNQFLARRCLEIMKTQLCFNICQLESSYLLDDEVPDLNDRVEALIPPVLRYTSRFWVDHLTQGTASEHVFKLVHDFLSYRFLFWMEVMNLTKSTVAGVVASTKLHMWLRSSDAFSDLVDLSHDAQTFFGKYNTHPVSASTPHIYISALPLSSPTNMIHSRYTPRFKGLVYASGTYMEQVDQASLGTWQTSSPIRSIFFSADGKLVAIGGNNGRICIKNSYDGSDIVEFKAHRKPISSVEFSNDGRLVASSSYDHTVCVWRVSDRSRVSIPFKGHSSRVNCATFSSDGMRIVSGSEDKTIRIWAIHNPSGLSLQLIGHAGSVRSLMFSPNGLMVASGSSDHSIRLWDAINGTCIRILQGHTQSVSCVRFSPCGEYIFSGSNDHTVRVWNTYSGASIGDPLRGHTSYVTSIAVSPEGERIASGSLDRTVRIWHRASGELMAGPFGDHTDSIRSVEFSADGARIISASDDKTIRIWSTEGKARGGSNKGALHTFPAITSLALSNDGTYVASGHEDGSIRVWNPQNVLRWPMWSYPRPLQGGISRLKFSSENTKLFVAYESLTLSVIDLATGEEVGGHPRHFYPLPKDTYNRIELSPDGRSAAICDIRDRELHVWDVQRNCLVRTIKTESRWGFLGVDLSSNSSRLATSDNGNEVNLWDRFTGEHLHLLHLWDLFAGERPPLPYMWDILNNVMTCGFRISLGGDHIFYQHNQELYMYDVAKAESTRVASSVIFWDYIAASSSGAYLAITDEESVQTYDLARKMMVDRFDYSNINCVSNSPRDFEPTSTDNFRVIIRHSDIELRCIWRQAEISLHLRKCNGWMIDKGSNRVLWLPPEIQSWFLTANRLDITQKGWLRIAYDNMLVGERWRECYIADISSSQDPVEYCP